MINFKQLKEKNKEILGSEDDACPNCGSFSWKGDHCPSCGYDPFDDSEGLSDVRTYEESVRLHYHGCPACGDMVCEHRLNELFTSEPDDSVMDENPKGYMALYPQGSHPKLTAAANFMDNYDPQFEYHGGKVDMPDDAENIILPTDDWDAEEIQTSYYDENTRYFIKEDVEEEMQKCPSCHSYFGWDPEAEYCDECGFGHPDLAHHIQDGDELSEKLSLKGRVSLSRAAHKRAAKLTLGRKRARRKTATHDQLMKRASRRARRHIQNQLSGGKFKKDHASHAGLNRMQTMINARKGQLDALRRRFLVKTRADDRNKQRGKRKRKKK